MRRLALILLVTTRLCADGGAVLVRQETGPFEVTLFASPAPLRTGPADLSVLVQDRESLQPVLDAEVAIKLIRGNSESLLRASHAHAQNKLLYAASMNLDEAGEWKYAISVQRGGIQRDVAGSMTAGPAAAALFSHWRAIALAPLCILLFAVHQWLSLLLRARPRYR